MNYNEADSKLQGRKKDKRKIANNTYLERRGDGDIALRLHLTDVITFKPNGDIVLNSGGYRTPLTKDRINLALPGPYFISQDKGVWYLLSRNSSISPCRFIDGAIIHPQGLLEGFEIDKPGAEKADRQLKVKVKAYAQLCADAVPLDLPNGGDCWFCTMTTNDKQTLGEATKNTDHLTSHMGEGYVVPSLVMTALKRYYNAPMAFYQSFKDTGWTEPKREFGRQAVKKAVYRYIMHQFGYNV